jgi:hypothetical protein
LVVIHYEAVVIAGAALFSTSWPAPIGDNDGENKEYNRRSDIAEFTTAGMKKRCQQHDKSQPNAGIGS